MVVISLVPYCRAPKPVQPSSSQLLAVLSRGSDARKKSKNEGQSERAPTSCRQIEGFRLDTLRKKHSNAGRTSVQRLGKQNFQNSGGPAWGTITDCFPPSADCSTGLIPDTDSALGGHKQKVVCRTQILTKLDVNGG